MYERQTPVGRYFPLYLKIRGQKIKEKKWLQKSIRKSSSIQVQVQVQVQVQFQLQKISKVEVKKTVQRPFPEKSDT